MSDDETPTTNVVRFVQKADRNKSEELKHRDLVLGYCLPDDADDSLVWVAQSRTADVLPDGRTAVISLDDGPLGDDSWSPMRRAFNDLFRIAQMSPVLAEIPNGRWLRIKVEVRDDWAEHPLNPENEWNSIDNISAPEDFEAIEPAVADRLRIKFPTVT
ncbi:hypothetical protein [Microvirga antarctica]|uniref:hypothetical protein n=1 Tax=Microvirga antarctica TaxID=2819233 RepID=UPI001B311AA1|nr:hypothetical protein [Microvirga antarctica]